MRFFLFVIVLVVGMTCGYEFALVLWVVGRIVLGVIANGAESSAKSQTYSSHNYRSSYQNSYQKDYRYNYQHNNTESGWQKTESNGMEYYYSVLGVPSNATDAEVKKAYRKLAMECHPDHCANSSEEVRKRANERFCIVNKAYEAIKKLRQMK